MYECKRCKRRFAGKRKEKISLRKKIWRDYVFGKQTFRELKKVYNLDKRTIRNEIEKYEIPLKIHKPREVNLIVDGTYWGERKKKTSWCSIVARDPKEKENLWWSFEDTETTGAYIKCRRDLETLGYTILSITGDGFGGIRQAFWGIPFQMCHVHMERLVVKGTTNKPKLEAGQVLLALVKSIYSTDSKTFKRRLEWYIQKYRKFLNEKTFNPYTGDSYWTHTPLRSALGSLINFQEYLFTFEKDRRIPPTSNSLEGHFSHVEDITDVHRGISRINKEKVLSSIFLASSIAPNEEILDEIL